jgi:hypothetical protein
MRARGEDERLRASRREQFSAHMDADFVMQSIRQKGILLDLTEEQESELEKKVRLVTAIARTLGKDFNLKVEPGDAWAYWLETKTLTMPMNEVMETDPDQCIALAIHEAGHCRITEVTDKSFYKQESKRLLLNAVEDPRVNNWMMKEYDGVKKHFMAPLYEKIFPREAESPFLRNFEANLPHVQFIYGLIHHWAHGEEHPSIQDEQVMDALIQTRPFAEEAFNTLPKGCPPNQQQLHEAALRATQIVRDEIWPVYERLVQRSVEMIEQGLKDGSIQFGEEGMRTGLSADELPKQAREMAEQASSKLADVLGRKVAEDEEDDETSDGERETEAEPGQIDSSDGENTGSALAELEESEGADGGTQKATAVPVVAAMSDEQQEQAKQILAKARQDLHKRVPYARYMDEVAPLIEQMAGFLEAMLEPDRAPRKAGFYKTGTAIHIPRYMQRRGSGSSQRDVFLRRVIPTQRDYRFSLILDESGSMRQNEKDYKAICATVLFAEVLERLRIPFEIAGFHSAQIVHKTYQDNQGYPQKEELVEEIHKAMGGGATHDVQAVQEAVGRLEDEFGTERFILVITDGAGNGPGRMSDVIDRALRDRIRLVGIGIGEGVEHVSRQYAEYVEVKRVQDLPTAIAGKIEELLLTA